MAEQTEKILLAASDLDLLVELEHYLTQAEFKIIIAITGQQALLKAASENPALTILDLELPDISGVEVCRQLHTTHPNISVIILTPRASNKDKIAGLEAGADDYIVKPVNADELILRVKAALGHFRESGQLEPKVFAPTASPSIQSPSTPADMETVDPPNLEQLLQAAARTSQFQNNNEARELYLQALKLDPDNEVALIWLAWHTTDPYEGIVYMEKLVTKHPENAQFQQFLTAGKRRCEELDQLISGSGVLGYWTMAEQIQHDRLQKNMDRRKAAFTPIGQLLLQKGLVTKEQLETAVTIHEMFIRLGERKKLGEVLLEYGYLTMEQLQTVLAEQLIDFNSNFY